MARTHQSRRSGRPLRLGFNEIAQFLSKSEVLVALSGFSSPYFFHRQSYFFFNIHIKGAPMFLKFDPYRVWCSIFIPNLFSVDKSIGSGCLFPDLDPAVNLIGHAAITEMIKLQFTTITDRIRNKIRNGYWFPKFSINRNFYRFAYDFWLY